MRLPTQIILLGALLTPGARAQINASDVAATPDAVTPPPVPPVQAGAVVELEPLLVTADLWRTPLEKMPASVSIYDETVLRSGGVRHFGDLADQVANLTWTGGTSRPRYFQIRGIGENSQYEGETPDSAVAFKVDDLDATGLGGLASTFDVRQVEILRGPQAGAFGANAAAGLVQIVTNAPTPYASGVVEGTIGTDSLYEAGVAVGGPIFADAPERLMFRIAAQHSQSDGFRRNVQLRKDTNARDEDMVRLRLTWNPNVIWRWEAGLLVADADNGYEEFALDNNGKRTFSDYVGRDEQQVFGGSVRGVYSGSERILFTTVTQAARSDSLYSYDEDWTAGTYYTSFAALERERTTWSQEFRLDSAAERDAAGVIDRWTLGVYAARLEEQSYFYKSTPRFLTDYVADSYSVFGQTGHDLGARTRLTLGARYERVENDGKLNQLRVGRPDFTSAFSDDLLGGKITLEQDLSDRHLLYASVGSGYKVGGVNYDANLNPTTDPLTYGTERLLNYEAGWRGAWRERSLTTEVTVFRMEREDSQFRGSLQTVGALDSFRYFTVNGGAATVQGLETALRQDLGEGWVVRGSLGLMDSERDAFRTPSGALAGARELAATPGHTYALALSRRVEGAGWFGEVSLNGRADYYESEGGPERRDAYHVVNASIGHAWQDWRVAFWARNLLDQAYAKRVFYFDNGEGARRYESRADPRQVGVTATYSF